MNAKPQLVALYSNKVVTLIPLSRCSCFHMRVDYFFIRKLAEQTISEPLDSYSFSGQSLNFLHEEDVPFRSLAAEGPLQLNTQDLTIYSSLRCFCFRTFNCCFHAVCSEGLQELPAIRFVFKVYVTPITRCLGLIISKLLIPTPSSVSAIINFDKSIKFSYLIVSYPIIFRIIRSVVELFAAS